jgi:cytochrome c peroxidase
VTVVCATVTGARQSDLSLARSVYAAQLDTLSQSLGALDAQCARAPLDTAAVRSAFAHARVAYKRVEWWLTFADQPAVMALNAPLAEVNEEPEDAADSLEAVAQGDVFATPVGLQGVESGLYPRVRPGACASGAAARAVARDLRPPGSDWSTDAIFEAVRAEVARVDALGLANDDSRLAHFGLAESAAAFDGMARVIATLGPGPLDSALRVGARALASGADSSFDRLGFLTREAAAVARALPPHARSGFWRTASLFDSGALDPWALAPKDAPGPSAAEIALGQTLFSDPTLGGRSGRSCMSCHQPFRAFTDGERVHPTRNTPTLLNAALERDLFWDLRAPTLEAQVSDVIMNPREMSGEPLDSIAARVARHGDPSVTAARIRFALAAYIRTLVRLDSRFDRALRGDTTAISREERRGFTIFMGKGQCGFCHIPPLFNGMAPPTFTQNGVEVLGVPRRADTAGARPDIDVGRYAISHDARDLYGFRVPSVRNAAVTAPYMHNGVYRTLDQVIDFYDRGGGEGIGARLTNQTLPLKPLRLSASEKHALIAFLGSLTDTSAATATASRTQGR